FVPLAWYVALPRTAASAAPEAGDGGPARPTAPVRRLAGASVQDSLDLNLRGTAEDVLLMRMRCTEPRPSYHRVRTYDRWDGRCWSLSNAATRRFWAEAPPFLVAPVDPGAREITQIVTVEHPTGPSLALVAAPAQVYFPTQDLYQDATGGLDAPGPLEAGTVYSAVSTCRAVPVDDIPRLPSRDALTDDPSMQRYLATPPSLRRLGRTLGARGRSPYEKALHVWKYVYTACTYDPAAPPGRRGDAVAHFLFESKRGGSEQFASAMVLLCRAAGVHARLATGYLPEPCNPLTGVYEVRSTDFHAWAEVYVPTLGWQTFDPSPGTLSAPHRQAADASPWLLGRLLARAGGWPVAIGAACLALAWWRRRSPRAKAACGRIEALYQCAVCTLPGHVPRRGAAETQRSFAARAARRAGCPELLALVALYEREKYGGRPASGADVARGERLLAAVKARARGRGAR
ncbi:MAG: transglutaminase domain-containing protein, partial [Armatimonadetes bacterium]|nr:transglutaminase domain-containing protein [Armatimonadota bacterium]